MLDDESVSDSDRVYRLVPDDPNFLIRDEATGAWRVSSAAFKFDPHCSVYRQELLAGRGLSWADIRRGAGHVCALRVGRIRGLDCGVIDEPDVEDPRFGWAHSSISTEQQGRGPLKRLQRGLSRIAILCE